MGSLNIKWISVLLTAFFLLMACQEDTSLQGLGQAYQAHKDYSSLKAALEALPPQPDTALLRSVLGPPIDMGFDYRYLIDSTGPEGCVVGAVFHLEDGYSDQRWIGQICE